MFEIRRSGQCLCCWDSPELTYPDWILKDMARNGLYLYYNGKRVKP